MVDAVICKLNGLIEMDKYCTEKIQPLLLNSKGSSVYFGKYDITGNYEIKFYSLYAKDHPTPEYFSVKVHPKDIKNFLESIGYDVEWVKMQKGYPAGYSSSGKTKYYNAGYNEYYTLKISY